MRTSVTASLAALASVMMCVTASAADAPALSGKMRELQYLVGTWTCRTKVPAMADLPAAAHTATVSFEVEPANAIGFDVTGASYGAAGFLGYSDKRKIWWSSGADVFGGVTAESGTSATSNRIVLTGATDQHGQRMLSRDTITTTNSKTYTDLYEVQREGRWVTGADSTCTKTSNTPQ